MDTRESPANSESGSQRARPAGGKAMQLFRLVIAAWLGLEIGAVFSAAWGLATAATIAAMGLTIFFCIVYCRYRLAYLLVFLIAAYAVSAMYSRHKIRNFCESISADTKPAQLPALAEEAGVEFHSSPDIDRVGEFYGAASDPFTVGDFACRVKFDATHVISNRALIH